MWGIKMGWMLRGLVVAMVLVVGVSFYDFEIGASSSCTPSSDDENFLCVQVLKNYDGDTITVNIANVHPLLGKKISIRISGLDTPEIKGHLPCEKEAARMAKRLVESILKNAKQVDLRNVGRDKYFRIDADVYADGVSLKTILMKNRLAYLYEGKTKEARDWCEIARGTSPR